MTTSSSATPPITRTRAADFASEEGQRLWRDSSWRSLLRNLEQAEHDPHNRDYAVTDSEVCSALARSDVDIPPVVRRRLEQMAAGAVPRPRGRVPKDTTERNHEHFALDYWTRRELMLQHLQAADRLGRFFRRLDWQDCPVAPAAIAYELTRRLYFPHISSRKTVENRLSKMRRALS